MPVRLPAVCPKRTFIWTGINVAEQTGEGWFEPELYRLKGEFLLRQFRTKKPGPKPPSDSP